MPPSKPVEFLDWNDSLSNVIDPPSGLKTTGYVPTEVPGAQHFNWIVNLMDQWIKWLDYDTSTLLPTTGVASKGSVDVAFGASPYTVDSSHNGKVINVDTTLGPVQLNLPDPLLNVAMVFTVKDISGNFGVNACTIHRFGTETFEGLASDYVAAAPSGSWNVFEADGNWELI